MRSVLGGRKKRRRSRKKKTSRTVRKFEKAFQQVQSETPSKSSTSLRARVDFLKTEIIAMEKKFLKLSRRIRHHQDRFASTPSLWPIYGKILSGYGWRVHPLKGKSQFHKGIDIPSWMGAPVKAAAQGVVEFSGWGGGYGWLVIIGHDYGYRTMYAHLSENLVSPGRKVRKGQIIGKIGESGLATGPHIHYEIQRWRRAIPPQSYLNLDLFTAVTKLW